jgi:carbon storage regulator
MLIFTRKPAESFRIGDDIKVTVLGFDKLGEVRIGIDAPSEVKVHRTEVYEKIHNAKEQGNG